MRYERTTIVSWYHYSSSLKQCVTSMWNFYPSQTHLDMQFFRYWCRFHGGNHIVFCWVHKVAQKPNRVLEGSLTFHAIIQEYLRVMNERRKTYCTNTSSTRSYNSVF